MTAKSIFLKDDLAKWWVSVSRDERFSRVMIFARAEAMEMQPTQEQLKGAEMMAALLMTLSDNEEGPSAFPTPGIVHKMPEKPRTDNPS